MTRVLGAPGAPQPDGAVGPAAEVLLLRCVVLADARRCPLSALTTVWVRSLLFATTVALLVTYMSGRLDAAEDVFWAVLTGVAAAAVAVLGAFARDPDADARERRD